jgi:hypothetical protein
MSLTLYDAPPYPADEALLEITSDGLVIPTIYNTGVIYNKENNKMVLRMIRQDTLEFVVTVLKDGAVYDISGSTFTLTAKYNYTDTTAEAIFTKTVGSGITLTTPASGILTVKINPEDTAAIPYHDTTLVFDMEMVPADSPSDRFTVLYGTLVIRPDVSNVDPGLIPQ